MEKPTSGKKGKCVNCEREKFIADGAGLCSSCHNAVAGISKDSGAYAIALADAKKRLINNPSRRGKVTRAKAPAAAPVKRVEPLPVTVIFKDSGPSAHDDIIKILNEHCEFHTQAADKFKQAIALLS